MWVLKKSDGILCTKKLPYVELVEESIQALEKMLAKNYVYNEDDYKSLVVPVLRNFESVLIFKANGSNAQDEDVNLFLNLIIELKKIPQLKENQEYISLNKKILSISKKIKKGYKIEDREWRSLIGVIEKYIISLKTIGKHYVHSFMNDYNKIAFSSSFRRLQDKAQVFPLEKHDYARSRLTHSIEVSSIASQIGNLCGQNLFKNDALTKKNIAFEMEKCLACASLLHDIGNPPFGHYGEDAIKAFFKNNWDCLKVFNFELGKEIPLKEIFKSEHIQLKNDLFHFDGNAQSFRIASKLQIYKVGHSLELTAGVLGSIIKYPLSSINITDAKEKFGYFYSESNIINMLEKMGVYKDNVRNPLAMLLEAADDISYVTSDLDDAIKKNIIDYEQFYNELKLIDAAADKSILQFKNNFITYYKQNLANKIESPFIYTISRMINDLRIQLIKEVVDTFCVRSEQIINGINCIKTETENSFFYDNKNEILKIINSAPLVKWIKESIFSKYIYPSKSIIENELAGDEIITTLMQYFVDAMLHLDFSVNSADTNDFVLSKNKKYSKKFFKYEKIYSLLSSNFKELFKNEIKDIETYSAEHIYHRLQLVVDYVSGMTDSYAKEVYQTIKGF